MKELPPQPPTRQKRASFWRSLRAVLWSLFGVRKKSDYQQDLEQLNPLHVLIVAVIVIFALVIGLMMLARLASG